VKHFHSLASEAQKYGVPIGELRGLVKPGHYAQVDEAQSEFRHLTDEVIRRAKI